MEKHFYPLGLLLKQVRYLLLVEDRLPPYFMSPHSEPLAFLTQIYRQLLSWQNQGVSQVEIIHAQDPKLNLNQPFYLYYLWTHRLRSMSKFEPKR